MPKKGSGKGKAAATTAAVPIEVTKYIEGLAKDQQPTVTAILGTIRDNIDSKGGVSIHLFCTYCDPTERGRLETEWKAAGCKWDAGKSCIRVKKLDQVPLEVLGASIHRMNADKFIEVYEGANPSAAKRAAKAKVASPAKRKRPTVDSESPSKVRKVSPKRAVKSRKAK